VVLLPSSGKLMKPTRLCFSQSADLIDRDYLILLAPTGWLSPESLTWRWIQTQLSKYYVVTENQAIQEHVFINAANVMYSYKTTWLKAKHWGPGIRCMRSTGSKECWERCISVLRNTGTKRIWNDGLFLAENTSFCKFEERALVWIWFTDSWLSFGHRHYCGKEIVELGGNAHAEFWRLEMCAE
jgi:hypothetical protein